MAEHLDRAAKGRLTGDSFRVSAPAMPGNSHIQDDSFSQSEIARPRASVDTSLLSQNTPQVQADSLLTDNNSGNGVGDKEDRPGAPDSATEDATASEQSGPKANSFQEGPSELQRSGKGFFVKLKGRETATDARMLTIMKSSSKRDFEMTGQVIPGSTALKRPTMEIGKGKKRPTVENKTIKDLKDGRGVPDSRVTNSRRSNLMGESFQSMVGISQEVLFSLAKEHEEDNPQEKSTSPRNNNHGGLDAMDEDDSTALLGAMRNGHSDDPTVGWPSLALECLSSSAHCIPSCLLPVGVRAFTAIRLFRPPVDLRHAWTGLLYVWACRPPHHAHSQKLAESPLGSRYLIGGSMRRR